MVMPRSAPPPDRARRAAPATLLVLSALSLVSVPSVAQAAGYSLDIEMVKANFSPGAVVGVQSPLQGRTGTWRVGGLVQFEDSPLILFTDNAEEGTVVGQRLALDLGVSWDASDRVSVHAIVPAALSFGSTVPELAADGPALGDPRIGGRIQITKNKRYGIGVGADLALPASTPGSYTGERGLRFLPVALGQVNVGPVSLLGNLGFTFRRPVDAAAEQDLQLANELNLGLGARALVWPDRFALTWGYVARETFGSFGDGGGENGSEVLIGGQIWPNRRVQVDIGAGKGVAEGVGSSNFRVYSGLTFATFPAEKVEVVKEPSLPVAMIEPEDIEVPLRPDEPPPEPEKPKWEEGELAKIAENQIIIRDPIQFELGTEKILEASLPTLDAVANLMAQNGQIAHLVIEGHASDEGSFEYNYDLSIRRARSIWQQLIVSGTHPSRLSYRGMGEVEPVRAGEDEESLALNRRVNFHIVGVYQSAEQAPKYQRDIKLPWSGAPFTVKEAVMPPPAEDPGKPKDGTLELDEE